MVTGGVFGIERDVHAYVLAQRGESELPSGEANDTLYLALLYVQHVAASDIATLKVLVR